MTALRSAPPASSQEAWAPRRSWKRTSWGRWERVMAGCQMRVRKVLREMGEPVLVEKRRSSGGVPVVVTCLWMWWQSWSPILMERCSLSLG